MELTCPFCSLGMPDLGLMTLHIDRIHSEPAPVDLPGLVLDDNGVEIFSGEVGPLIEDATITFDAKADYDNEDDQWVECPQAGCAEAVLLSDLVDHLDFHDAEAACLEDSKASRSNSNSPPQSNTSVSLPLCSLKKDTNPPQLRDSVRSTQAQGPSRVSKRGRSIESDSSAQNHIDSRSKRSPNERDSPIAKVRRHGRTTRQSTNGSTSFVYLDESDKPAPTGDKLIGYFPSTPQHDRVPQRARRERRHDGVKLKRLGVSYSIS